MAFLKRRLKLRSGMPDCLTACSIGLATEKWPLSHFLGAANRCVSVIGHGLENDIGRKTVGVSLETRRTSPRFARPSDPRAEQ